MATSVYDFTVTKMNGEHYSLSEYQGRPMIIVNTASKCGLTPQFAGLEKLYQEYPDLVVLGFPCNQFLGQDPGSNEEIETFCQRNYGVTFPMHQKIKVRGKDTDPLFAYLIEESDGKKIKWNFTKFLIDRDGHLVARFEPKQTPEEMIDFLESII